MVATISGVGLGRVFDVVPIAASQGISLANCNAIDYVCTNTGGATTYTLTVATTFAGTYRAASFFTPNYTPFTYKYVRAADTAGTVAWVRTSQTAAATVTSSTDSGTTDTGSNTCVFSLLATSMPDGYVYAKITATGGTGLVTAILHDMSVARKPVNLQVPGA